MNDNNGNKLCGRCVERVRSLAENDGRKLTAAEVREEASPATIEVRGTISSDSGDNRRVPYHAFLCDDDADTVSSDCDPRWKLYRRIELKTTVV